MTESSETDGVGARRCRAGARQQVVDDAGEPLDLGDRDVGLLLDDVERRRCRRSPPAA